MTEARELADLVHALQGARTPLKKLRVLALAWRTVRAMTPFERERIAMELGFDGARQLVDRLAQHEGGITPALLMEAIGRAEQADPNDARAVLRALRDPEQRKGVLKRGLETLETYLTTGSWQGRPPDAAGTEPPPEAAAPRTPPPVPKESAAEPRSFAGRPSAASPPPVPGSATSPARVAVPEAPRPEPEDRRVALGPIPVASVPVSAPASPAGAGARAAASEATAPGVPPLVAALASGGSVLARLRMLRARLEEMAGSGPAEVAQVLEAFPVGWARRRALAALLERGIPAGIDDALALIDGLAGPAARRWCLASLLRSPVLPPDQRGRVEALAGRVRVRPRRGPAAGLRA